MQKIIIRDEIAVQKHHVPPIAEEEEVVDPNHFATNLSYHRSENDCFIYSFMGIHENGFVDQSVEDQSGNLMFMFDVIPYIDELPKYDQYYDDYIVEIEAEYLRKSTTCCSEEKVQLQQLKYNT